MIDEQRALSAFSDVLAVEYDEDAGVMRVVTIRDVYMVIPTDGLHQCPDREYHDVDFCKHVTAAEITRDKIDAPTGWLVIDDLDERTDETFTLDTEGTLFGARYHLTFDEFDDVAETDDCDCSDDDDLPCFECYNEQKKRERVTA